MGGSEESIHDMNWVWVCVRRSGTAAVVLLRWRYCVGVAKVAPGAVMSPAWPGARRSSVTRVWRRPAGWGNWECGHAWVARGYNLRKTLCHRGGIPTARPGASGGPGG